MILFHSYVSARGMQKKGMSAQAATKAAVGTMISHVKYLQHRPGEDREKGGRQFYDEWGHEIDGAVIRKEIRQLGGKGVVIHKLLLAPDVNPSDPLAYAQEVMHGIEAEKGLDLTWRMVVHKNTKYHHVNVICYGKDKSGKEVRFSKRDHNRMREIGDGWMDRNHPVEREQKRLDREKKKDLARDKRGRDQEKAKLARQAYNRRHYIDGWKYEAMHQMYLSSERLPGQKADKLPEKVTVDGVTYTKESSLEDLRKLDDYLWDHDMDLPRAEARELRKWIYRHERTADRSQGAQSKERKKPEFDPEKYAQRILDLQKQDIAKNEIYGQKGDLAGGKWTDPVQQAVTSTRAFSVFQKTASMANELVKSIQLLDTRDFYKLAQDELDDRLRAFEDVWKRLKGTEFQAEVEEVIQKIHDAKKRLEEGRAQQIKERKRSRQLDDPDLDMMG